MMIIKRAFLLLFVLFFVQSCSVEKRHYMSGYHIDWKGKNPRHDLTSIETKVVKQKHLTSDASITSKSLGIANEIAPMVELNTASTEANAYPSIIKNSSHQISYIQNKVSSNQPHLNFVQRIQKTKQLKRLIKAKNDHGELELSLILLYILCFLLPFIAVGLVTDWELEPLVINIILCCLFWLPGIIHALYVVYKTTH